MTSISAFGRLRQADLSEYEASLSTQCVLGQSEIYSET